MTIQLDERPELAGQIISCPRSKREVDILKDPCCNTCLHSERIYADQKIMVGLFCPNEKRVVDAREMCGDPYTPSLPE